MATAQSTERLSIAPELRGIDHDDPILDLMPKFDVPCVASQYPTLGKSGRLVMRVEVRSESDQLLWSKDYDQLTEGDPS